MLRYLLIRLLQGIAVLVASVGLIFFLGRLSGDPVVILLPMDASAEAVADVRNRLGLDRPVAQQFLSYVSAAMRGDFGRSYFEQRTVSVIILEYLPNTLKLAVFALALTLLVSIPVGVLSAVYRNSWFDRFAQAVAVAGASMPVFWTGILLIQIFSVWLGVLPSFGSASALSILLPGINLVLYSFPESSRLTRSAMIGVLSEDYIRTAFAKGASHSYVIVRHALRNAALPIVTMLSLQMGGLLGGAVITETVFSWPGVGWLVLRSIGRRDFPVVQGVVGYVAIVFVVITIATDLLYTVINPKVRYA